MEPSDAAANDPSQVRSTGGDCRRTVGVLTGKNAEPHLPLLDCATVQQTYELANGVVVLRPALVTGSVGWKNQGEVTVGVSEDAARRYVVPVGSLARLDWPTAEIAEGQALELAHDLLSLQSRHREILR
jgi:hypothetical protein